MQAYVPLVFAFPWRVKRLPTAFVQWDQQPFVRYAKIRTHCTSHGIREGDGQHWLRRQKQYGPSWSLGPSAIRSQGRLALLPLNGGRFGRNDLCQHVERRLPLATPRALTTTHLAQLAVAMLRPTLIRAAHVHKPLIRFPDRRAPKSMCLSASGPSN